MVGKSEDLITRDETACATATLDYSPPVPESPTLLVPGARRERSPHAKTEPLALFAAMVGRPSSGRSTVIEIAQHALQHAETAIMGYGANTPCSSAGSQELSAPSSMLW